MSECHKSECYECLQEELISLKLEINQLKAKLAKHSHSKEEIDSYSKYLRDTHSHETSMLDL